MSPRKIGYIGALLFVVGFLVQFLIAPVILKSQLKRKLSLKKGWIMRDIWGKLPFTMESHMYIFNVTNPREIGQGAKPIVRQIGPFVYDLYEEKTQQVDNEKDDTVSYVLKNTYHYNREKSQGLSDEVEVYFPHPYLMTSSNGVLKYNPVLVSYTSRAVDTILNNPDSLFYKATARTVLFDGFPIPCGGVEEYFGKLICNVLRERWFDYTVRKRGDTFYASMFGFLNGTYDKQKRVRINRGIKNLEDLAKLVEVNEMRNLSTWKNRECDEFQGTDGSMFSPGIKGRADIVFVHPLLCRKIRLTYDSQIEFSGLKLLRYTGDLGTDGNHVPEDKCYCITPDTCLRKGMLEVFQCHNVPIIVSNVHFYKADPYYLGRVDTLKPDKEKHQIYADFDPLTGLPVRGHMRVQFNMELLQVERFWFTQNFTYAMLPMVWMDQTLVLPDFLIDEIKFGHRMNALLKVLEYIMMIGGFGMCVLAAYMEYQSRKVTELNLKPTNTSAEKKEANESRVVRTVSGNMRAAVAPLNVD